MTNKTNELPEIDFKSLKSITHINEGYTDTEKLITFLEAFYGYNNHNNENVELLHKYIKTIKNHEGSWEIIFYEIPPSDLVLHLISVFAEKFYFDALDLIIFNYEKENEIEFKELAGTCGLNISEIFNFLRISELEASEKRRKEWEARNKGASTKEIVIDFNGHDFVNVDFESREILEEEILSELKDKKVGDQIAISRVTHSMAMELFEIIYLSDDLLVVKHCGGVS